MTESKSGLNWGTYETDSIADMAKYGHSNTFFHNKFQSRNTLIFNEFSNLLSEYHHHQHQQQLYQQEPNLMNNTNNINFIGDISDTQLKTNNNLIMQDKSKLPNNSNINTTTNNNNNNNNNINTNTNTNNMNDYISTSYGFNKFIPRCYQNDFQLTPKLTTPQNTTTNNTLPSFPFYFPFMGPSCRRPLPPELIEEEPIYVNPRQYERIIKRRIQKANRGINMEMMLSDKNKTKPYKHLSRHLHAKRRVRGKGGRFLSKEEAEKEKDIIPHTHDAKSRYSLSKNHSSSTSNSSNEELSQEDRDIIKSERDISDNNIVHERQSSSC